MLIAIYIAEFQKIVLTLIKKILRIPKILQRVQDNSGILLNVQGGFVLVFSVRDLSFCISQTPKSTIFTIL